MVGRVLTSLIAGLAVFCACRHTTNFAPRLETGTVPDTTQVIGVLPESGAVQISKNGYRKFDLDAIVTDQDDSDSTIRWSLSPGPLLNVILRGDTVLIGPAANQVGESHVVFSATDPGGLSTSRTCLIAVFDTFSIDLPDMVTIDSGKAKEVALTYKYRADLKDKLKWRPPSFDDSLLAKCSLDDSLKPTKLTLQARGYTGTTGIYLEVRDSVNHVTFSYSTLVTVE